MEATTALYNQYKSAIYKQAQAVVRKNPSLELEDVIQEGSLIFCKACETFDEDRGVKFITHLYNKLLELKNLLGSTYAKDGAGNSYLKESFEALQEKKVGKDGKQMDGWEPLEASEEYSKKMEESSSEWTERIEDLKQYAANLGPDELQMLNDILDGHLNPSEVSRAGMGRKAYLRAVSNMSPATMLMRRYKKMGWNLAKVAQTRKRLEFAIGQWKHSLAPMELNVLVSEGFLF